MKRVLLGCLGAFCLLTASTFADEGLPSTSVLDDMGLSGMQILSDSDAVAIRGKGWMPDPPDLHEHNGDKPWVTAGGLSLAMLDHEGARGGSLNFYLAEGKYKAGGENISIATKTFEKRTVHSYNDHVETKIRTYTKTISAGGSSSAYAF
ncbi:MAG: hypothetical protein GTO53_04200 [Planctomycetales bacterium]|nr:hypothetical protein [Planctomycetales bacterium]NIM08359.1 hypothetical protein [Planctomycetales bacterium]NIN07835.1 hypothetical protein [Planctomycetales bacterium]NIN76963.1 hypothetical protein [Planctomycetales bacterium]NIO34147.1 hypothetical protein [Planctomycetales bacterium]